MVKVGVYGTLKRGERNHRLLAGRSFFMQEDTIKAALFDLGPYPACKPGEDTVSVEIFTVGDNTLSDLDRLEGHPVYYKRELVKTAGGHDVWVYFMLDVPSSAMYIPEGIWHRRAA